MKKKTTFAWEKYDVKMGQKRKERQSVETLFSTVSSMLVPAHVLEHFEIWDAHESKERWVIEMREKEGRLPLELSAYDDVVFDGYCNPLETLSHSFVCKPIYLRLFRRRYKVLKDIIEEQSYYYNTEQQEKFLETSESIYRLIFPEMPVNSVLHEESGRIFRLPTEYLMEKQEKLVSCQKELRAAYPQINEMSESDYRLLLSTAFQASYIYGESQLEFPIPSFLPSGAALQNCLTNAGLVMTGALTIATVEYTASMASCGGFIVPMAIGACMVVSTVLYGYSVYSAYQSYQTSVALCHYQYGN